MPKGIMHFTHLSSHVVPGIRPRTILRKQKQLGMESASVCSRPAQAQSVPGLLKLSLFRLVQLFTALQLPLAMGLPWQEY